MHQHHKVRGYTGITSTSVEARLGQMFRAHNCFPYTYRRETLHIDSL